LRVGVIVFVFMMAGQYATAARIGLDPLMGDGANGRKIVIAGSLFEPSTSYTVLIGGYAVVPAAVSSNAAGIIPSTGIELPSLPGGNLDVTLTSTFSRNFTGAFRVWPNICLAPAMGNGKAGATYVTNAAIPTGGWNGMVFIVQGTGFAANAAIGANTITVGGSATTHPAIAVTADGRLNSTTIIITSNLTNGAKDIVINDGSAKTFSGVYTVVRAIGLNPARGSRNAGTPVTITGWGFTNGAPRIAANSITIGGITTTHGAVNVVNGTFTVTLTVDLQLGNGTANAVVINDGTANTFAGAYHSNNTTAFIAVAPVRLTGIANEAIQVQGIAGIGANIAANAIGMYEGNTVRSATVHSAITVAGGTFPATWVKIVGDLPWGVNRLETGATRVQSFVAGAYLSVCPAISNGYSGWTVTLTGYGFNQTGGTGQPAANSSTIGGVATTHVAVVVDNTGDFTIPCTVTQPLPFGVKNVVINDSVAGSWTFPGAIQVARTIGLSSFVVGSGAAGETVSISGSGFTASTNLAANSITFGAYATIHPLITVGANGSFGPTAVTLPLMNSGPYNVVTQGTFQSAYRVYDPISTVTKYRDPGHGVATQIVTFSFSFTNAQYVGDPSARTFRLTDNLPAALQYVAASSTCYPPATAEWFNGAWIGVEPVPASSVTAIRWTISALPAGASGWAKFQMVIP